MYTIIRKALRYVVAALAIVGLFNVAVWAHARLSGEKPEYVTSLPSPDGQYKAALATWAGGGALSPYCYEQLTVVPAEASPEEMAAGDNAVFEGECTTGDSPSIAWQGNDTLQVGFAVSETDVKTSTFKLRRKDASGRIVVDFEILP